MRLALIFFRIALVFAFLIFEMAHIIVKLFSKLLPFLSSIYLLNEHKNNLYIINLH